jgi:hypothetical protein
MSHDPFSIENFTDPRWLTYPQSQNSYSYGNQNPVNNVDPDGKYAESGLDLAFLAYDLSELNRNLDEGNYYDASVDGLSTVGDLVGLALPGATGIGMGVRYVGHGGDTNKAFSGGLKIVDQTIQGAKNSKLGGEIQNILLPKVQNDKVKNIITDMFRSSDKSPGGTVGALKNEAKTGLPTGGKFHDIKAQNTVNRIENLIGNKSVTLTKYENNLLGTLKTSLNKGINLFKSLIK